VRMAMEGRAMDLGHKIHGFIDEASRYINEI
jgi:hypothetical protein